MKKNDSLTKLFNDEMLNEELKYEQLKFLYSIIITGFSIVTLILIYISYINKKRKSDLLKGQNILIDKQNKKLEQINSSINKELNTLQITLDDKKELLDNIFSKPSKNELPPEILKLSKREKEVLSYLALGYSDNQLAEKLFISKTTVKTHLRKIYSKLLVRGRAEAVNIAHKYEIIEFN